MAQGSSNMDADKASLPQIMNSEIYTKSATREFLEPIEATIKGTVPTWITGSLYRNGPAKFEVGKDKYNHYFDGLAMVQKFEIKAGKVSFRSQFLKSETYKRNMSANRIVVSEFGTASFPDPCKNIFQRYLSYFTSATMTDNTSVNVFPMGDELYCATEVPLLNQIDPTTLDVIKKHDLNKIVTVYTATAHPHYEPNGSIHNVGMGRGDRGPTYVIVRFDPQKDAVKTAKQVASVKARWPFNPGYMHSFGMSENYYIIMESALAVNVLKMKALSIFCKPFLNAIEWHEGYPTLLHVVSKATGECQTFETDPFFAFHQVNAFEEDGHLIVDLACFRTGEIIHKVDVKSFSKDKQIISDDDVPLVKRFVLPLNPDPKAGDANLVKLVSSKATAHFVPGSKDKKVHCSPEQLFDISLEFPAIHYQRFNTKKYRYLYGVGMMEGNNKDGERLIKCDIETRETKIWQEAGCYPSEPVFVPAPNAQDEDEGVLLSAVIAFNGNGQRYQYLLILDTKTMKELARAELPEVSVPKTFHGNFLSNWF